MFSRSLPPISSVTSFTSLPGPSSAWRRSISSPACSRWPWPPQAPRTRGRKAATSGQRIGLLRVRYGDPGGDPEQELEEDAAAQQEIRRRPLLPLEGEAGDEGYGEERPGGGGDD